MRNLLKISVLSLAFLTLITAWPGRADASNPYSVLVEPGLTELKMGGEDFIVVSTQRLRINFSGIQPFHVWGSMVPLDGVSNDIVKFIWMRRNSDPITLHFGVLLGAQLNFDSEDVTGHNEKFD
jgi:hypothetical protein